MLFLLNFNSNDDTEHFDDIESINKGLSKCQPKEKRLLFITITVESEINKPQTNIEQELIYWCTHQADIIS